MNEPPSPLCPRCRSTRLDTGIRTDPATGEPRKRCHCNQCGHEFWRSEGVAAAMETSR
jgi:hypothetical protein